MLLLKRSAAGTVSELHFTTSLADRKMALQQQPDNWGNVNLTPKRRFGVGAMDRFTSMAVFKQAVDGGSFAAAARHFGISPEMAGNHVRSLESRLGVRLLNRTTRQLHPTEAGARYLSRCTAILAEIEEAETEASALQLSPRGLLRIAAPVTLGVLHVAPALSDYMARYPEVSVDIAVSDRFVNLIEEGFDLAIRIGDLPESSLIVRRLTSARLIVCASPAYLKRTGRPETPDDLTRHACLIYTETGSPATWWFQSADGHAQTVRVSGPLTSTNAAFLHRMALAGHGIVLGPNFAFTTDITAGLLVPLLPNWRSRELSVNVLYPHRPLLSIKIRSFVDFLAERFGETASWET